VSAASVGSAIDPDGYAILLDGTDTGPLGANSSVSVDVVVGDYEVELAGLADNCGVIGENPLGATVAEDAAATVQFSVACPPFYDYIAFYSSREEGRGIFVMTPDGSNPVNITRDSAFYRYPTWSPDATRIAFTRDEIHVLDIAEQSVTRLTENANVELCAWSPDGTRIAYSSFTGEVQGDAWGDIYVMNADGTDPVNLTPGPARSFDPAWSPDGSQIAFSRRVEDVTNIWVMQADGSNPIRLTDHRPFDVSIEPAWSPDGSRIAYTGPAGPPEPPAAGGKIWVMDADGSNRVSLTTTGQYTHVHRPTWSPDGSRIAFWAYKGFAEGTEKGYEIYVMDADGSNQENLTNDPGYDVNPTWSPGQ
jgi:TolB protein